MYIQGTVRGWSNTLLFHRKWSWMVRESILFYHFCMSSYEEAPLQSDTSSHVVSLVSHSQNAALGAHALILEDGPGTPDLSRPILSDRHKLPDSSLAPEPDRASQGSSGSNNEGGGVMEAMYAPGGEPIAQSRISGRAGGPVTGSGARRQDS
jgi:hypothetical protein